MAMRAPHPCPRLGCPTLVPYGGECPAHPRKRTYDDSRRGTSKERGYGDSWGALRAAVLAEEPFCAECLRRDQTTPADVVDHIIPMSKGGAPRDRGNLQPLCTTCHNRKTAAER